MGTVQNVPLLYFPETGLETIVEATSGRQKIKIKSKKSIYKKLKFDIIQSGRENQKGEKQKMARAKTVGAVHTHTHK